jgi:hypothetical protein
VVSEKEREKDGNPTCLYDVGPGSYVQPRSNEGYIGKIQDLCAMWKGHGPELWGGTQDVDETAAVTGGNFGTVRETDEVVVAVRTEFAVEQFPGCDFERLNELSRLCFCLIFFLARKRNEKVLQAIR